MSGSSAAVGWRLAVNLENELHVPSGRSKLHTGPALALVILNAGDESAESKPSLNQCVGERTNSRESEPSVQFPHAKWSTHSRKGTRPGSRVHSSDDCDPSFRTPSRRTIPSAEDHSLWLVRPGPAARTQRRGHFGRHAGANEIDKSVQILNAIDPSFSVDLIVRTPYNLEWRLHKEEIGFCEK